MTERSLIARKRREQGLSQSDLARLAGLSRPTVGYAEAGHRGGRRRPVGDKALSQIAGALGLSVDELRDDAQYDPLRAAMRDLAAKRIDAEAFAKRVNAALEQLGSSARVGVAEERPEGAVCACRRVEEGGDDS